MHSDKPLREQVAGVIEAAQDQTMERIDDGDPSVEGWPTLHVADAAIQAVLEGMRCGSCRRYTEYYEQVTNYNRSTNTCLDGWAQGKGPSHGCIRWEAKDEQ